MSPALAAAVLLSGAAALLYEVVWARLWGLACGRGVLAVSAVLCAFMTGLALGGRWGGRAADRLAPRRALALYALLEAAIAVSGWLSRPLIDAAGRTLAQAGLPSAAPWVQGAALFAACLLVLAVPTALMGATIPVLTSALGREKGGERRFAPLYGLNTAGAVAGAAAAGFLLLPALGLRKTLLIAGAMNLAAAALAGALARRTPEGPARAPRAARLSPPGRLHMLLFLSGAAAMACQTAWTRALALFLGSSTYAFTLTLATFLLGLALGALAFARLRREASVRGLGLLAASLAASVAAPLPMLDKLPYVVARLHPWSVLGDGLLHLSQLLVCAAVVLAPTLLMGALLPWTVAALSPEDRRVGAETGRCLAANTAGAIAGSAAAGLLLLPGIGAERTLLLAAWGYGACAALAWSVSRTRWASAALAAALAIASLRPGWDPRLLATGMSLYAPMYQDLGGYKGFLAAMRSDRVIFYKDGLSSTVAVLESPWGERFLRLNGKTDASLSGDMATQVLLGALPLALYPRAPRRALVVGFGSGATAAALATEPSLEAIEVAEIEPVVAEAAPFFERANRGVLRDPRTRLILADARSVLAAGGPDYDIITSEPSNPWIAGVAQLYTREAFELARGRLSERGVFCQWFHGYYMSEEDVRLILSTFASVFPRAMLMSTGSSDFFLVGSKTPFDIEYARVERLFKTNRVLRADLERIGLGFDHPFTFLVAGLLLAEADLRRYAEGAPVHEDDRPTLEFSAPRQIHRGDPKEILKRLLARKTAVLPDGLRGIEPGPSELALMYTLSAEAFLEPKGLAEAERGFRKAIELSPSPRAWTGLGRALAAKGDKAGAESAYRRALAPGYGPARLHLGGLLAGRGLRKQGLALLEEGLRLSPGHPTGTLAAARLHLEAGRPARARELLSAALRLPVPDQDLRRNLVDALREADLLESGGASR